MSQKPPITPFPEFKAFEPPREGATDRRTDGSDTRMVVYLVRRYWKAATVVLGILTFIAFRSGWGYFTPRSSLADVEQRLYVHMDAGRSDSLRIWAEILEQRDSLFTYRSRQRFIADVLCGHILAAADRRRPRLETERAFVDWCDAMAGRSPTFRGTP